MASLPNATFAIIEPEKLRDYVLSPEHRFGRHKARVFVSVLGIDRGDWEYLRDQIASRLENADVSEVRAGRYGMRYSVPILVEGLNGERMKSRLAGSLKRKARRRASRPPTSMSREPVRVLDVVELTAASGRWPRGTEGTVLEPFESEAALVEISDDRGHTLEELELPLDVLRSLGSPVQEQLPVR